MVDKHLPRCLGLLLGLYAALLVCPSSFAQEAAEKPAGSAPEKVLTKDSADVWREELLLEKPTREHEDFNTLRNVVPDRVVVVPTEPELAATVQELLESAGDKGPEQGQSATQILAVRYAFKYGSGLWWSPGAVTFGRPPSSPDHFELELRVKLAVLNTQKNILEGYPERKLNTDTSNCSSEIASLFEAILEDAKAQKTELEKAISGAPDQIVRVIHTIDGQNKSLSPELRKRIAGLQVKHADWRFRQRAVGVLSRTDPEEHVEALRGAANDSETDVRCALAEGLLQGVDAKNAQGLLPLLTLLSLDPDGYIRERSARALGKTGLPGAFRPLAALARDSDLDVRKATAGALDTLGLKEGAEVLVGFLEDADDELASAAHGALGKLGWQPTTTEEKVKYYLCDDDAVGELAALGQEAVSLLIPQLASENKRRVARAVRALAGIPDPRAAAPLLECLKDEDSSVAVAAVEALAQLNHKEAIAPIIEFVRQEDDKTLRMTAIRALGEYGDAAGAAVEPLCQRLGAGDDDECIAVADALSKIGVPSAADRLREALGKRAPESRVAIAYRAALARLGGPQGEHMESLIGQLVGDGGNAALDALSAMDLKGVDTKPLAEILNHQDPAARGRAAKLMGQIGGTECVDLLWKRLTVEEHVAVRAAIRDAIRRASR